MNRKQAIALRGYIAAHVRAQKELTWIGARDAEMHELIREDAAKAKERLYAFIRSITDAGQVHNGASTEADVGAVSGEGQ